MDLYIFQSVSFFSASILISCLFFKDHKKALKLTIAPITLFFLSGVAISYLGRGESLFEILLSAHYLFLAAAVSCLIKLSIPPKADHAGITQLKSLRGLK